MTDGKWDFWIDRGGTFTDVVARTPEGPLESLKLLSDNPGHYADAATEGIRRLMKLKPGAAIPSAQIGAVKMGTTVATNALLERRGAKTVLVTTMGLGDQLAIGYQHRPRLFDLDVRKLEQLYDRVIEVDERVSASGNVLRAPNIPAARAALEEAKAAGFEAAAICFLHGYRFHDHEQAVAELARDVGFGQVSVSHEASPLMKFVGRGDTTVADAYLSPVLRRYIDLVAGEMTGTGSVDAPLYFMQSNGGLTRADLFQGKDAILSGPAGGVVGMVKTAALAGAQRVIGFDMGGTSTDVSHFNGEFERTFESEVAGVRIRAPMLSIHTVAAGGGSIIHYDGTRLRVGPQSAGADPGPACYGKDGPLTVTDANLMTGRIKAELFPKIFGPNADQGMDLRAAGAKMDALAKEMGQTFEEVADGCLEIAIEAMAQAIKKISTARGYDVSRYTLACFGGAAGQTACRVADKLGMTDILIHPLASLLSAYGMGLADIRALREQAVERDLDPAAVKAMETGLAELGRAAKEEVTAQGVDEGRITLMPRAHIRYAGTDTALPVEAGTLDEMTTRFTEAHAQQFGFSDPGRKLILEALSAEAVGHAHSAEETEQPPRTSGALAPVSDVDFYAEGKWHDAPLFSRADFQPSDTIEGPALIFDPHSMLVVEPGWRAEVTNLGHIRMKRVKPLPSRRGAGTAADPITLEIFNNLFMSIAEQMGVTLEKTASSVNIKERLDFSCAVFDAEGGLVANAPHMPVHLGSMGDSVKAIIDAHRKTMRAGDVYVLNDPYKGGTHLPDITVVTPVFDADGTEILFYTAARGHHADVGGIMPGSMPPHSRSIDEEGAHLDRMLLVRDGKFLEDDVRAVLMAGPYPVRNADQNIADLKAQVAACEKGIRELRRMVDMFGLETVKAYMGHVQSNAEEAVRQVIGTLKDGAFTYKMDDGSQIQVAITVDQDACTATIDFTGTSPQVATNYNAPLPVVRAAVLYVFRCLVADDIPLNAGCLIPLRLIVPEGCMLNPRKPAAVVAGNVETSQVVVDCLFGALGTMAASQGTMNNLTFGNHQVQYYETICGGAGAGPGFDGADAIHTHMTNSRLTDPEILEWRYPVRLEEFSIRHGSGGAGAHKGGDGVTRTITFLEDMEAAILSGHRIVPPFGMSGGASGAVGRTIVTRVDGTRSELKFADRADVRAGDAITIETPGGGGYGNPKGANA